MYNKYKCSLQARTRCNKDNNWIEVSYLENRLPLVKTLLFLGSKVNILIYTYFDVGVIYEIYIDDLTYFEYKSLFSLN